LREGDNLLVILRGVNLNPGAEPDDMISIRMWVEADRVISLRYPKLRAVGDVVEQIDRSHQPAAPGAVVDLDTALHG